MIGSTAIDIQFLAFSSYFFITAQATAIVHQNTKIWYKIDALINEIIHN